MGKALAESEKSSIFAARYFGGYFAFLFLSYIIMVYKIFKIQLENRELMIGETAFSERHEAFESIFIDDFMKTNKLCFTNSRESLRFAHEYMWKPCGGITVMKLGYEREAEAIEPYWDHSLQKDYPHCVVVISLKDYHPYICVAEYAPAFKRADDVASIFSHTLGKVLWRYGLSLYITSCKEEDAVNWANFMYREYLDAKKYQQDKIERLNNYGKSNKFQEMELLVRNLLKATDILNYIKKLILQGKGPKDKLVPLAAAIEADVFIRPPSHSEFTKWIPEINISSTSYYRLIQHESKTYLGKKEFGELVDNIKNCLIS